MSLWRCSNKLNFLLRQALKRKKKWTKLLFYSVLSAIVTGFFLIRLNNNPLAIQIPFIFIEPITSYYRFEHSDMKKDWHDYRVIEREALRKGPGEQGAPVIVAEEDEALAKEIFEKNNHNGFVSDMIARDRSIQDTRPLECGVKHYLAELPTVSVIIPFYNEVLSTLTRTIHSVFTRSPPELLKEVILVNDHSDNDDSYGPLEEYISDHFDRKKIRILVMPAKSGLMWARLAGARAASGDVLVFLDCHTEANVNWLPPLIEPIAENYRSLVCPIIDAINANNYHYKGKKPTRGTFTWQFNYQFLPLRPQDESSPTDPFETPVMVGCAFAISAKFFWEFGGYDTGLEVWGGEQFELSFKVWLCGGRHLDAPCSRVGHLYRPRAATKGENRGGYVFKNYKRVAEVWMDEYKEHVYRRSKMWENIDAGDISRMLALKQKLKCKPFEFFLKEVASDMLDRYPAIDPPSFAFGGIQSLHDPKFCIDTLGDERGEPIGIYNCKNELSNPGFRQTFRLRNHRDISIENSNSDCFDLSYGKIIIYNCKFEQSNQYFRYDLDSKQIFCGGKQKSLCLDMDSQLRQVLVTKCSIDKTTQKWTWGVVNETMLQNWGDYGKPILDETEANEFRKTIKN